MDSNAVIHSGRPSAIDYLRSAEATVTTQVLAIAGFAFLTALGAQVQIYVWEVPFTLQTLAVYGSGLFLGWRNGMLSQVLYLVLGLFLPVYAGGESGPDILLFGVTAGYLFGFPVAAALSGAFSQRWNGLMGNVLSVLAGSFGLFTCGVIWLHYFAGHGTWFESIDKGWLRFIPIDLAKVLFVGLIYSGTRRFAKKDSGN
jgi:biotin transport system substrate-specific component